MPADSLGPFADACPGVNAKTAPAARAIAAGDHMRIRRLRLVVSPIAAMDCVDSLIGITSSHRSVVDRNWNPRRALTGGRSLV
jgi:hypothetical protein